MIESGKGKMNKLKVTPFCITLLLVLFYDYFPQRVIDIHLHPN
jgi:hypothetical protein